MGQDLDENDAAQRAEEALLTVFKPAIVPMEDEPEQEQQQEPENSKVSDEVSGSVLGKRTAEDSLTTDGNKTQGDYYNLDLHDEGEVSPLPCLN